MYEMGANEPTCTPLATPLPICAHKRRPEESKLAKIELTKMGKLMAKETISPAHTFNTYASPVHNRYCSEEKVDIM